ncbi:MAG: hypothetical protein OEM52_07615 [bacterium]|nr:hypothetical protein [bacterium]
MIHNLRKWTRINRLIVSLALGWCGTVEAQAPIDFSQDSVGFGYREAVNERSGLFGLHRQFFAPRETGMLDIQSSVLSRTVSGFEPHFKENLKLNFRYDWQVSDNWSITGLTDAEGFRDRQIGKPAELGTAGIITRDYSIRPTNQMVTGQELIQERGRLLGGVTHSNKTIVTNANIGIAYDEDQGDAGFGPATEWRFLIDSVQWSDWRIQATTDYRHAWLSPREDALGNLGFLINRFYASDETELLWEGRVQRILRDIPGDASYRRNEWQGNSRIGVRFPAKNGEWRLTADIDGARVRQGETLPSFSHLRDENQIAWSFRKNAAETNIAYRFGYQSSRSGQLVQYDRSEGFDIFGGVGNASFDSLTILLQANATRTDTPDSLDYNDRDEYRWRIVTAAKKMVASGVRWSGDVSVLNLNNKYLSKYQSSTNRATRTYQIGSDISQTWFANTHKFRTEVAATYVLYDFKLVNQPLRDVLSRRLTFVDSLSLFIGIGVLLWHLRADFEDRGYFNRERYEQSVSEEIHTFVGSMRYRFPIHHTIIESGITAYRRSPFRFEQRAGGSTRIAETDVAGIGPIAAIERIPGNGWRCYGKASMLYVSRSPRGKYMQNDVSIVLARYW